MGHLPTLVAAFLGLGLVAAQAPPGAPSIVSVSYSGNGCPQGTRNEMFADEDSLNFAFHDFGARLGGDGGRTANCQVHLNLAGGGAGWALSLETVNVRGQLQQSTNSEISFFTTAFWSQSPSDTITKERRIANRGTSSTQRDVNIRQQISVASPCGGVGILNVNFRAALTDGSSGAFVASGSTPVTEELSFAWKRC